MDFSSKGPWNLYFALVIVSILVVLTFLASVGLVLGAVSSLLTLDLGSMLLATFSAVITMYGFMAYTKMWHLTYDCAQDESCKWRNKTF